MTTMSTLTLTEFLSARLDEDAAAAKAVPPLDHNYDMGGNRQDERWVFDRTLPSSADGMGNWSEHRHSPTTRAHFERHDPARVLADVRAKRGIVDILTYSSGGITQPTGPEQEAVLRYLATVYANHPDYREEWRP